MKFTKIIHKETKEPSLIKRSRAKMWIKIIMFIIFASLFSISILADVKSGIISYGTIAILFFPSLILGLWLRKIVPLQVHKMFSHITFSFDKIYFSIILGLYLIKKTCEIMDVNHIVADISMIIILGLMVGRIIGLFFRLNKLKKAHF